MKIQKLLLPVLVVVMASVWFTTGCDTKDTKLPTDPGNQNQSPPMPPYDLIAIAVSPTEIQLTWKDQSDNETGFEIFESINNDTSYVRIDPVVERDVETVVLTGKLRENDYYYKIRAYNGFGPSSFSNETDVRGGAKILEIDAGEGAVLSVAFSPHGNYIVAGCSDYRIRRYNAYTGDLLQTLEVHQHHVNSVAYSPDSLRIASASDDGTVKVWNTKPDQHLEYTFQEDAMGVDEVEFSPDNRYLASGGYNVCIWDLEDGSLVSKFGYNDTTGGIISFAYHPNGRYIFASGRDKIEIWDLEMPESFMYRQRTVGARSLKVSSDGMFLTGAYVDDVWIWEIVGEGDDMRVDSLAVLTSRDGGHTDAVYTVDFSPDGLYIASGSRDNTTKVWDAVNFTLLGTLREHDPAVYCLDFSPDGFRLATGGGDTKIKIWSMYF